MFIGWRLGLRRFVIRLLGRLLVVDEMSYSRSNYLMGLLSSSSYAMIDHSSVEIDLSVPCNSIQYASDRMGIWMIQFALKSRIDRHYDIRATIDRIGNA